MALKTSIADFDPQQVLPTQWQVPYFDSPEQRLMAAVLLEAVHQYTLHAQHPDVPYKVRELWRIRDWFHIHNKEWPFSYHNICAALDIEHTRFRRLVFQEAHKHQRLPKRPKKRGRG